MEQPRYWKSVERHPLSGEYKDINGKKWDQMNADFNKYGIVQGRTIKLYKDPTDFSLKVLDGWQLYRLCVENDVKPVFEEAHLPNGMTPEEYVEIQNNNRRHEDQEIQEKRAHKRRERVEKMRQEGMSLNAIAEQENVSQATVREDLRVLGSQGANLEPVGGKVTGKDGKTQSASREKLLCSRCRRIGTPIRDCEKCKQLRTYAKNGRQKPERQPGDDSAAEKANKAAAKRNGKMVFDWSGFNAKHFSPVMRLPAEITKAYGKAVRQTEDYKEAMRLLNELAKHVTGWRKRLVAEKKEK